jgi:hypothetical protein
MATDMEDEDINHDYAKAPALDNTSPAPLTDTELSRRFHLIELEFQRSDSRLKKLEGICSNVAQTNNDISSQLKDLALLVNKIALPNPRSTRNARVFPEVEEDADIDLSLGSDSSPCL